MNIGFNPTVAGENLSIEIHYFNFNSDLYDQEIVSIIQYIPEQNSIGWLIESTIGKDKISPWLT
jgi:riboflavin kinase/FMN adenylyltransferase